MTNTVSWLLLFFVLFQFSCQKKNHNHWTQFRGINATGIAPENAKPPIYFSLEKNVLWKLEAPEGLSSPIAIDDNIILTGVNRNKKEYYVWNINSNNGMINWESKIVVTGMEKVHPTSSPANATPASDGEFIYCYFPSFGLVCYDLIGNKVWEKQIKYQKVLTGSGTSPVIHENKLILNNDNLVEPRLIVLDKSNGKLLWEHNFDKKKMVSSCGWSTPVIWENQLIIHRNNGIEGVNLDDGKEIFRYQIGTMGESTPVINNDILYVNAWMVRGEKELLREVDDFQSLFLKIDADNSETITRKEFRAEYPKGVPINERTEAKDMQFSTFRIYWDMLNDFDDNKDKIISKEEWQGLVKRMEDFSNHGLVAIQLGGTGNINLSSELWKVNENVAETPSVIVDNGLVYMIRNGGRTTCVDASSGKVIYKEKLGTGGTYFSSPILANGMIYFLSYKGKVTIVKAGENFEIVNQIDLEEKIGASPIAFDDKLIVRTASHLYAFKNL